MALEMSLGIHSEFEIKLAADHIDRQEFERWAEHYHPDSCDTSTSPDFYYRRGKDVIRHRVQVGKNGEAELTVKQRKSEHSTLNRVEIDLRIASSTSSYSVQAFLLATGWKECLRLHKTFSNTYVFGHAIVSLYEVKDANLPTKKGRFLEVEISKTSGLTESEAASLLLLWKKALTVLFVGQSMEPLNKSLYEIFSGKTYRLAKET